MFEDEFVSRFSEFQASCFNQFFTGSFSALIGGKKTKEKVTHSSNYLCRPAAVEPILGGPNVHFKIHVKKGTKISQTPKQFRDKKLTSTKQNSTLKRR